MAAKRNPQTAAKRDREQANREKRERKREKKAAVAAARLAGEPVPAHAVEHAVELPGPTSLGAPTP